MGCPGPGTGHRWGGFSLSPLELTSRFCQKVFYYFMNECSVWWLRRRGLEAELPSSVTPLSVTLDLSECLPSALGPGVAGA